MFKILFILIFTGLRWLALLALLLVAFGLLIAIIALPFILVAGALSALFTRKPAPPPAELYIAKETTMPAFLSMISYALLVALMLGIGLGWMGGL